MAEVSLTALLDEIYKDINKHSTTVLTAVYWITEYLRECENYLFAVDLERLWKWIEVIDSYGPRGAYTLHSISRPVDLSITGITGIRRYTEAVKINVNKNGDPREYAELKKYNKYMVACEQLGISPHHSLASRILALRESVPKC